MAANDPYVLLLSNYLPDGQYSMQRFTRQLADGLEGSGLKVDIYPVPTAFGHLGASASGLGKWLGYIDKYLVFPFLLKWKLSRCPGRCIVHIIDHSNAPYTKWLGNVPHLVTCHDMLAVRSALGEVPQNKPKWTGKQQQAMILRGLKRSRCIASVSQATQADVSRLLGEREEWCHVIPNGLNDTFIDRARKNAAPSGRAHSLRKKMPESVPYVMHIGGEKWYKNRNAVLEIFARLAMKAPELHLVVVGPPFNESALSKTGCSGLRDRIIYLNNIGDEELCDVYGGAELLLFPSCAEGFGWPVIEAQACGCAVCTFAVEPMRSLNAVDELKVGETDEIDTLAEAAWRYMETSEEYKNEKRTRVRRFASKFTNEASVKAYIRLYRRYNIR